MSSELSTSETSQDTSSTPESPPALELPARPKKPRTEKQKAAQQKGLETMRARQALQLAEKRVAKEREKELEVVQHVEKMVGIPLVEKVRAKRAGLDLAAAPEPSAVGKDDRYEKLMAAHEALLARLNAAAPAKKPRKPRAPNKPKAAAESRGANAVAQAPAQAAPPADDDFGLRSCRMFFRD